MRTPSGPLCDVGLAMALDVPTSKIAPVPPTDARTTSRMVGIVLRILRRSCSSTAIIFSSFIDVVVVMENPSLFDFRGPRDDEHWRAAGNHRVVVPLMSCVPVGVF